LRINSMAAGRRRPTAGAGGMKLGAWRPGKLGASASAHLDVVRALAAWAVMWGHLRALFFVDFHHVTRPSLLLKAVYFLTGFGHQAVMVFFVLSGFLISSTVIKNHLSGTWSWRDYAISRATRLYVVLVPGLVLGLVWDFAGSSLFAGKGIYAHPLSGLGPAIVTDNLNAANFFGCMFYLQGKLCQSFGSNGPLWSLANEFWYYVLFPVALAAGMAWAGRSVRAAVPLTILALAVGWFNGFERFLGFLVWMAGCALVFAYSRFRLRARPALMAYVLATFAVLAACLVSARTRSGTAMGSDLAVGLAFTFFLYGIMQFESGTVSPLYAGNARRFAAFSYTLYVLHFPLLLFLRTWIVPVERWQPNAVTAACGILIGAGVLFFAWGVSLFTERKTPQVRDWVRKLLAPKNPELVS
jgi:peptidoglycan/LPS O-acetylase OafA/YrhL